MKSIYKPSEELTRIDGANKHTKQDYYIGENSLLKLTSLSPFKNGFLFLVGIVTLIPGLAFLIEGSLFQKPISIIFFPLSFLALFSRRELLISQGKVSRIAYVKIFGKSYVLWESILDLNSFSEARVFWTHHDGRTYHEAQAHLEIYSEKMGKTVSVMNFLLNHDGQKLLSEVITDVERVLGLKIDVKHRESYLGDC